MESIIDLSHTIRVGMPVYPGTPTPLINSVCTHDIDGFAELELNFTSHTGTHVDAPSHIFKGAKSLTEFPPGKFAGKALKINCDKDNSSLVKEIENKIDIFGKPDFLILNTGWSSYWGSNEYFEVFPLPNGKTFEFISSLNLKGIGIDAISIDRVGSVELINHRHILGKDYIIIENLTNLKLLPEGMFDFFCFPLKIENADGSPVRAIAIYSD